VLVVGCWLFVVGVFDCMCVCVRVCRHVVCVWGAVVAGREYDEWFDNGDGGFIGGLGFDCEFVVERSGFVGFFGFDESVGVCFERVCEELYVDDGFCER
jgi:hypothetical protein